MSNTKLNNLEAIALLSIIMANKIILNFPEFIISSTGSAAWINTLYITFIAFIFSSLVLMLMKKFPGSDILDISYKLGGKYLKIIVSVIQIVLLFFIACSTIKGFSYTLKTIYFNQTPIMFIVLLMVIPIYFADKLGLKSISKVCLYILPVAYIGLIILLLAPIKDFEPQRIFPILGYGFNSTFISGLSNLYALSGLGYIFLLPSKLDTNTNINKITFISLILSSIALFFSILCILFIFSFQVNTNENMTLYLLTMWVHHGNIIHGINVLYMLIWILSIISYLSITIFFIIWIIKRIFNLEKTASKSSSRSITFVKYIIITLLLICSVIFQNNPEIYIKTQKYMIPSILIFVFILDPLILLLASIKTKLKKCIKKLCCISLIISMLFCFTGCYDANGIEDLAYVVAIGLDIDGNNELILSVQIATAESSNPESSSSGSSGSTSQSKSSNITTIKCSTIDSGLSLINNHISKKLNLSHCQVVVISEELARLGISPYLDTLLNNSELRNDCSIIISKCLAKDYLNSVNPALESLTARFYESTLNSAKYSGYTVDVTLFEFYSKMKDSCSQAYAILGNMLSNGTEVNSIENGDYTAGNSPITDKDIIDNLGIAVFKDDKMVGELSGLDSICHIIVNNELKSCVFSIPDSISSEKDEDFNKYIDLQLTADKKTKYKVELINESPHITIDVYLLAQGLSMNNSINYDDINQLNTIKSTVSDYLTKQITSYLIKTSKELESDISGLGVYALKNYLTIQDWNASNWLDNYKNATFDVTVHLKVKSGNLFDKT